MSEKTLFQSHGLTYKRTIPFEYTWSTDIFVAVDFIETGVEVIVTRSEMTKAKANFLMQGTVKAAFILMAFFFSPVKGLELA